MARRMLLLAALAAFALAPLASAQLNCYVTSDTLYPPPPPPSPPMPPITGIPPFTGIPPIVIPTARDYIISYLQMYGAYFGPAGFETAVVIGTERAIPSVGSFYTACIQYDSSEAVTVTSPAAAAGVRVTRTGTYVAGITTDCNTFNTLSAAAARIPTPARVPWVWNAVIYQYTLIEDTPSTGSVSCCNTNLCNSGSASVVTQLGAAAAIANMALLVISALACIVLGKML